jgi:hypothetical protein
MLKYILYGVIGVLVILQFFQIDKNNPAADPAKDFMTIHNPPAEVAGMLKTACYDCHSYKTSYPWYTYTQPLAWWIKDHIDHSRDELNFSEWGDYSPRRADHKLEEAVEYTLNEEMPLPSYTWAHGDARLSDEQRETLADWFEAQREIVYPDSLRVLEEDS